MCEKCECEQCRKEQALATGSSGVECDVLTDVSRPPSDWHRADILAAVKKKGSTLAALSRQAGLSGSTLSNVFYRPWPKGERIVSDFLGIPASQIWPKRYRRDG